jgi:predicted DNA-binding transcriptional regulator AlpA
MNPPEAAADNSGIILFDRKNLPPARFGAHEADRMLTRKDAAEFLGVSVSTMEQWRAKGVGPACIKVGPRKVGYPLRNLLALGAASNKTAA